MDNIVICNAVFDWLDCDSDCMGVWDWLVLSSSNPLVAYWWIIFFSNQRVDVRLLSIFGTISHGKNHVKPNGGVFPSFPPSG